MIIIILASNICRPVSSAVCIHNAGSFVIYTHLCAWTHPYFDILISRSNNPTQKAIYYRPITNADVYSFQNFIWSSTEFPTRFLLQTDCGIARVGITGRGGQVGVGPPVQFATPRSITFYELGVGSNPSSWPQLSFYLCAWTAFCFNHVRTAADGRQKGVWD
jgi:hypothetical protein